MRHAPIKYVEKGLSIAAEGDVVGVALIDLSTGEFTSAEYAGAEGRRDIPRDAEGDFGAGL